MDGRGEPRDQAIGMLATIARLIDEGLADTREQYATLLEARPKPRVLDDALVALSPALLAITASALERVRDFLAASPDPSDPVPYTKGHRRGRRRVRLRAATRAAGQSPRRVRVGMEQKPPLSRSVLRTCRLHMARSSRSWRACRSIGGDPQQHFSDATDVDDDVAALGVVCFGAQVCPPARPGPAPHGLARRIGSPPPRRRSARPRRRRHARVHPGLRGRLPQPVPARRGRALSG